MRLMRMAARPVVQRLGIQAAAERYLDWEANVPVRLTNLIFQRILRLNHECAFSVNFTSRITAAKELKVHPSARRCFATSGGCYFQAMNGIAIGEDTIFAAGVKMISADHRQGDLRRHVAADPIVIGRRCWIGANAVILPGTRLGDEVVVAAGSVVRGRFPAKCLIAGVPGRVVRHSQTDE